MNPTSPQTQPQVYDFKTPLVGQSSTPEPIALDKLMTAQSPITLPKAATPTAPVTQMPNYADQVLQQMAVPESNLQKQASDLSMKIANLVPGLQGESAALAQEQQVAGVNKFKQDLQDINNQITLKNAELQQDDVRLAQSLQNIEDKPIAMEFITGQQQSVQRNAQLARALKQSEIGILNARAIATQGNVSLAMETAKQAVETKFAPYKEAINTYKSQLEAIQPLLTRDEKKQAQEQQIRVDLAMNDIKQKQSDQSDIQKLVINAASQEAPASLTSRAAQAKTPAEAASILGAYAGDYLKLQLLKQQIATEKAQRAKIYSSISSGAQTSGGVPSAAPLVFPKGINETTRRQLETQYAATLGMTTELNKYKDLINKYGNVEVLPGEGKKAIENQKAIITGLIKDAQQLGTLDNGVLTLVDQMVGSTGISNAFTSNKASQDAITNLNRSFQDSLYNKAKAVGAVVNDVTPVTTGAKSGVPTAESMFDMFSNIQVDKKQSFIDSLK